MCVLSTLCANVDKHSPFDIYIYIVSNPVFADADTGIYPHAASQYHARPKDTSGIAAMLSVDPFPYPRNLSHAQKIFVTF